MSAAEAAMEGCIAAGGKCEGGVPSSNGGCAWVPGGERTGVEGQLQDLLFEDGRCAGGMDADGLVERIAARKVASEGWRVRRVRKLCMHTWRRGYENSGCGSGRFGLDGAQEENKRSYCAASADLWWSFAAAF